MRPSWLNPLYELQVIPLGAFVTLTNVGSTYDATNAGLGLGFADVDMTNVANIDFVVKVSKVGTGTQSWQLWNETNSTELAVIDDAGAAGNKTLSTTAAVALTGIKRLRIRAKSTVAADDPLYYGASVTLR